MKLQKKSATITRFFWKKKVIGNFKWRWDCRERHMTCSDLTWKTRSWTCIPVGLRCRICVLWLNPHWFLQVGVRQACLAKECHSTSDHVCRPGKSLRWILSWGSWEALPILTDLPPEGKDTKAGTPWLHLSAFICPWASWDLYCRGPVFGSDRRGTNSTHGGRQAASV